MYVLPLQGGLRPGSTITFRLLSFVDKSSVAIHAVAFVKRESSGNTASTAYEGEAAPLSQMDGIRDLLTQLAASEISENGPDAANSDPKRALMAAIAKSTLKKSTRSSGGSGGGGGGLAVSPRSLADSSSPLLHQLLSTVQQQQREIAELRASVARLELICSETLALVKNQQLCHQNTTTTTGAGAVGEDVLTTLHANTTD